MVIRSSGSGGRKEDTSHPIFISPGAYFPDFKIDEHYYEIKGGHLISKDHQHLIDPIKKCETPETKSKMECIKQNNVTIVSEEMIKTCLKYIYTKYGKHYLKQFKNYNFKENKEKEKQNG